MEQPDPVIHQPLRLKIMAVLNGLPRGERLEFVRLRAIVNPAEGNLSAHLGTLDKAGYIKVEKDFNGRKPRTRISLTDTGTRAYADYAAYLRTKFPDWIEQGGGTGISAEILEPSCAPDPEFRRSLAPIERLSASPASMIALIRMNHQIDVREILPSVGVPTLVLHHAGDPRVSVKAGRYLGRHGPGAKYIGLLGNARRPNLAESDRLVDEIEEWLTGSRDTADPGRVLATVLFTDIVESARQAATLGDRAWRQVLDRHELAARQEIARFRGRAVKSLGDGLLATFNGPARAVRCAGAIGERVRPLGIELRSGLHTGEIESRGDDVAGIAVHIAARVAETAGSGEVVVSSTVRDLVAGSGLVFEDRGSHALRGLPEPLRLYRAAA
jgi:class 3 adenylate cyclase/DNA-binding MarR family transcriptional regulator